MNSCGINGEAALFYFCICAAIPIINEFLLNTGDWYSKYIHAHFGDFLADGNIRGTGFIIAVFLPLYVLALILWFIFMGFPRLLAAIFNYIRRGFGAMRKHLKETGTKKKEDKPNKQPRGLESLEEKDDWNPGKF